MRPGFSYSPRGLLNVIIAKACHMPVMYYRLALLAARWFSGGDDGLVPAGSSWAGLSWSRLGWALQPLCLSHKHCVLLAHCSIEGDISYLCHTHNLMNMVISVPLWSFLEHCLIHLVHVLLFMQTRCTQQRHIIGGNNAFALWHCYCFEYEKISAFVASWKGKFRAGALGTYCRLPQRNKVWCFRSIYTHTPTGLRRRTHSGTFYYWIWNTLHITQPLN